MTGTMKESTIKIGILTFHRAHNYGAFLQACALCARLNAENNIDAEIIDYRMHAEERRYNAKSFPFKKKVFQILHGTYCFNRTLSRTFDKAIHNSYMKLSSDALVSDSLEEFKNFVSGKYDVIVVGSDEVWKADSYRGFPTAYWLFGDYHCRKMSYAASSRIHLKEVLTPDQYSDIQDALADFEFLGVRDTFTMSEISAAVDHPEKVHLCCDPSFLYDFRTAGPDVLKKISRKRGFHPNRRTIMVMLDNKEAAEYVRAQLGTSYNLISVFHPHKGYINLPDIDPFEWLALIQNTDFVIASFFHAVCFSIVNNRPFLAVGTKGKKSKLIDLLNTPEMMSRYIEIGSQPDLMSEVERIRSSDNCYDHYVKDKRETFSSFLTALNDTPLEKEEDAKRR